MTLTHSIQHTQIPNICQLSQTADMPDSAQYWPISIANPIIGAPLLNICAKCFQIYYGQTFLCVQVCRYIVKQNAHAYMYMVNLRSGAFCANRRQPIRS